MITNVESTTLSTLLEFKVAVTCLLIKVNGEHVINSLFTVLVKPFYIKPVLFFGKKRCSEVSCRGGSE